MKIAMYRCDECGSEETLVSPQRFPSGWRRREVNEMEVWDLCPVCVKGNGIAPKAAKTGEVNRDLVSNLLELHPARTDQQIAEEAWRWGVQMAGETVRRHRIALGIPDSRQRRRAERNRGDPFNPCT
jgi:hypothetical protein